VENKPVSSFVVSLVKALNAMSVRLSGYSVTNKWQLDSKPQRSFRCLLAEVPWKINEQTAAVALAQYKLLSRDKRIILNKQTNKQDGLCQLVIRFGDIIGVLCKVYKNSVFET